VKNLSLKFALVLSSLLAGCQLTGSPLWTRDVGEVRSDILGNYTMRKASGDSKAELVIIRKSSSQANGYELVRAEGAVLQFSLVKLGDWRFVDMTMPTKDGLHAVWRYSESDGQIVLYSSTKLDTSSRAMQYRQTLKIEGDESLIRVPRAGETLANTKPPGAQARATATTSELQNSLRKYGDLFNQVVYEFARRN